MLLLARGETQCAGRHGRREWRGRHRRTLTDPWGSAKAAWTVCPSTLARRVRPAYNLSPYLRECALPATPRQSLGGLPAACWAIWRPLLRHAAGARAATALGSCWSRGPKAPLDAGGGRRASRSSGGEPAKRDLLLEQRLVKCGQVRICPTQCPLPCFACVTSTCFACH